MSELTRVFFVEPTTVVRVWFRRYRSSRLGKCGEQGGYCDARVPASDQELPINSHDMPDQLAVDDARWPQRCERCGEKFAEDDPRQTFYQRVYRASDGREWSIGELPPGAVYDANWYGKSMVGPDGRTLVACLPPGGASSADLWVIDGPSKNGSGWTREGRPEDGTLSVRPSIMTPRYHGFLRSFSASEARRRGVEPGSYLEEC